MSFEGYYQVRCKNKHYYTIDCYTFDSEHKCQVCGSEVKSNLVDITNGEGDGYDPSMEDGADRQVYLWESELNELKSKLEKAEKTIEDLDDIIESNEFEGYSDQYQKIRYALDLYYGVKKYEY